MNALTLAELNKPHQFIRVGWQRSNERVNGPDSMHVVYPIMAENMNFPNDMRGQRDLKFEIMPEATYVNFHSGPSYHIHHQEKPND